VRSTTLLFTPRCTLVQILGVNLGQSNLHRKQFMLERMTSPVPPRPALQSAAMRRRPPRRRTAVPRPVRGLARAHQALASATHTPQAVPRAGSRASHAKRAHHSAGPSAGHTCRGRLHALHGKPGPPAAIP
jgi:hypothetical protein